ncbi:MAG TPA: MOP flippase family protein [candidate division Zixibacteria bacterium]|nr:MOP flippase family protein [candidate division Zixibacteria bacterium]
MNRNIDKAESAENSAEGLTRKTIRGVFWSGMSQFISHGISFLVNIVVARLLFPEDFGILGMAAVYIELVSVISDLGINASIIQRDKVSQSQLSTCFWLNQIVAVTLIGLSVLCAPLVAQFYRAEILSSVIIVSSLSLIPRMLGSVHKTLLTRHLAFKTIAAPDIIGIMVFSVLVIPMTWGGLGLWSIILANLAGAWATTIGLWKWSGWRPAWTFDWKGYRGLISFGSKVLGEQLIGYIILNIDYLMIGRLLGPYALGVYTLAYNLMTFPQRKIAQVVTRVTFPAFSRVQNNDALLREAYLKTVRYISLVTFPILTGMGILAADFIHVVYTDKWVEAVVPLQIMCLDGLIRTVGTTVGSILYAKGRADIGLKWKIVASGVILPSIIVGSNYGIIGVAVALTGTTIVLSPIIQIITNRLIGLRFKELGHALAPATISTLLMVGGLSGMLWLRMEYGMDAQIIFLVSAVLFGALVYTTSFRLFFRIYYTELFGMFHHVKG